MCRGLLFELLIVCRVVRVDEIEVDDRMLVGEMCCECAKDVGCVLRRVQKSQDPEPRFSSPMASDSSGGCIRGSHTLYFSRSSLLRGALMIVRRTLEGAEKCALRDFLLEEDRAAHGLGQSAVCFAAALQSEQSIQVLILVILSALGESGMSCRKGR